MKPYIIAELAQGYEGSAAQAALLVKAALNAGADAVKLQLVYADDLATADYEHYRLFGTLEMPDEIWVELRGVARSGGIGFYLDVFGARSLALAEQIGVDGVKVHSTDMANAGLIAAIARSAVPQVLLSVGGCSMAEIDEALSAIGGKEAVLLLGFQGYPTPIEANQVRRLGSLITRHGDRAKTRFGFADHADPDEDLALMMPAAALGAGATVFEKHLTLAQTLKLEDHESALNPDQFARFSAALRACAVALGEVREGDAFFGMHATEKVYREKTRKHVVAAGDLAAGGVIKAADVVLKRSTSRAPLFDAGAAIGRRLRHDIAAGQPLTAADLEDA